MQGTVVRVEQLQPERPGPNAPRILFSIILAVDLLLVLGPLVLVVIGTLVALTVVLAMLGMRWMITLSGFLLQSFFYFLSPIIGGLLPGNRERERKPVTNYLIRTDSGKTQTFRIKGQLQGATIAEGDRVQVQGRPHHGILMFRRGRKLDTGEELTLPFNWSWVVLALAILANVAGYVALSG